MKELELLLPLVLPYLSGCSDSFAIQALRMAAIELCSRTDIVQRVLVQGVAAGEQEVEVPVPLGMELSRVMGVWVGDTRLRAVATDGVNSGAALASDDSAAERMRGTPGLYFQPTPTANVISLYPVPDRDADLVVRAAFQPALDAVALDEELHAQYGEAVAAGALSRLLNTPGQSFTNPQFGAAWLVRFERAVEAARRQTATGKIHGSRRVAPRRWA